MAVREKIAEHKDSVVGRKAVEERKAAAGRMAVGVGHTVAVERMALEFVVACLSQACIQADFATLVGHHRVAGLSGELAFCNADRTSQGCPA